VKCVLDRSIFDCVLIFVELFFFRNKRTFNVLERFFFIKIFDWVQIEKVFLYDSLEHVFQSNYLLNWH
jgi:hypothetical protein